MTRIRVATTIAAPPKTVWAEVSDLGRHAEWMRDAVGIRFTSPSRRGVGTTFDCDTRVGPFRLLDRMEVVEWREGRAIGIRHRGVVTGTGRFTIRRTLRGRTRFAWTEDLRFPWWLGGPIAESVARPVLASLWRRNLRTLAGRLEHRRRRGFRRRG